MSWDLMEMTVIADDLISFVSFRAYLLAFVISRALRASERANG